ncbi:MAG: NBR1-Ig-like domain-containing protein [Anaerolineales bacterium]
MFESTSLVIRKLTRGSLLLGLGGILLLLAACTRSALPPDQGLFIPPTLQGNSTPLVLETSTLLPASATPPCDNNLVFLRDVTVPDGQHFQAGQPIDKTWEVRNDGTCPWIRGYSINLVDGHALGAIDRQALPETQPGETVSITIQFRAPQEPGNYRSSWKAHDLGGEPFGVQVFMEIIVE